MKKITLLLAAVLGGLTASAQGTQDFYVFSESTGTYTDLANPVSVNNGTVWQFDDFGPFTSPFPLSVFGQTFNEFGFEDDFFYLGSLPPSFTSFDGALFIPVGGFFVDRDFSLQGPSQSPISYEVTGTTGSRILKLEMKNAGSEVEFLFFPTVSTLYMNFQVWFYEADNSIEFHYGSHNLTEPENLVGIIYFDFNGGNEEALGGFVSGDIANPDYDEIDENDEPAELNDVPAPNTIYRFAVNPLAVKDTEKVAFNIYPNPTAEILNLSFEENINKEYAVYDLSGRNVLSGTTNNENNVQINVSSLQNGTYILKVGGTVKRFVKK